MELERGLLAAVLGLLSGAWLPAVSVQPRTQAPPTQPWAASDQRGALAPAPPAWGSWKAFLGLQDGGRWGPGATGRALALPLDPQEVAQERCRAVPFVQVLTRPRCTTTRVHNRLCFGHCASLYVPGSEAILSSCNSCVPARTRRMPIALWCGMGGPRTPRRVKISAELVEGCRCGPKL
ncbi:DAN domain family member 5 [Cavia porcellus]|uniref:DAN domain family member 5 n=1 Tax=Cavia porcellus TaxID=10141 RepID=UPI00022B6192|nr:DAN domain family member 5 [Cavia porcellus]